MVEVETWPKFVYIFYISHIPPLHKVKEFVQSAALLHLGRNEAFPLLSFSFLSPPASLQLVFGYSCWIRTQKVGVNSSSTTYCVTAVYPCFFMTTYKTLRHFHENEILYITHLAKLPVIVLSLITLPVAIYSEPTISL